MDSETYNKYNHSLQRESFTTQAFRIIRTYCVLVFNNFSSYVLKFFMRKYKCLIILFISVNPISKKPQLIASWYNRTFIYKKIDFHKKEFKRSYIFKCPILSEPAQSPYLTACKPISLVYGSWKPTFPCCITIYLNSFVLCNAHEV